MRGGGGGGGSTHHPSLINPMQNYLPYKSRKVFQEKLQNLFCKILKNKWYHAKILLKRFHLNDHTKGFRLQSQTTRHVFITDSGSKRLHILLTWLNYIFLSVLSLIQWGLQ